MAKKCILILINGLGDRSYESLGFKTPLQAAKTPHLDHLAGKGANGLYHPGKLGEAFPGESAHFTMFGYDFEKFPGRGALVALGAGVDFGPGNVGIVAHLGSVREIENYLVLQKHKVPVSSEEITSLMNDLKSYETEGVSFRYHRVKGNFGVLVLKGKVSRYITDTNHMLEGLPVPEIRPWYLHIEDDRSRRTAQALKNFQMWSFRKLNMHPVNQARIEKGQVPLNFIFTQRAGQLESLKTFRDCIGLSAISLSSEVEYKGLAKYIGMDFQQVYDSNDPGRDLADRLETARELIGTYDFVHVHTKAADAAARQKNPLLKKQVIESLDTGIGKAIGPIIEDPDILLAISSDHSTPSSGPLIHSGEPVPLLFCGDSVRRDMVEQFNEINAACGALGMVRGREFMQLVLNYLDRVKLAGTMDSPMAHPFWPGDFDAFRME